MSRNSRAILLATTILTALAAQPAHAQPAHAQQIPAQQIPAPQTAEPQPPQAPAPNQPTPAQATAPQQVTLPPVEVRGEPVDGPPVQQTTAGPVRGYQALTSQSATRTDTPINEIPRSIQVIPRSLIDDQGAITQSQMLRNVSGVQPLNPLFAGQLTPLVRGFRAERYIDGLPNYYDVGARDLLVNVERIEVLKGPDGILYQGGAGLLGGVVNVISRLPTATRFADFGMRGGSYGYWSPTFDINQPLTADGTVLARITGQYESTRSNIDFLHSKSFEINPAVTFTNNTDTTVTLQFRYAKREQQDYPGLPAVGTLDTSGYTVRRTLFASSPQLPNASSEIAAVTLRGEHRINDVWSVNGIARFSRSRFSEPSQLLLGNEPFIPPSYFAVWNGKLGESNTEFAGNVNAVARFNLGPTRNVILFGADYNRVTDKGYLNAEFADLVDFNSPHFPTYHTPPGGPFTTFTHIDNIYRNYGASAQIQSTIYERLHVLAGLRVGTVDINSNELTIGSSFHTQETKVLPRVGAVFDLLPGLGIFADYAEGLRPVPFFNGPNAPKPEGSEMWEVGVKLNTSFGLSGTLAFFNLVRTNVPTPSLLIPGTSVQAGEQRSRGFEADLLWQPNANFSLLASYAHISAQVVKDNSLPVGDVPAGVPTNSGRVWANYRFIDGPMNGLSMGAGLYAASSQAITLPNRWFTPGYVTFDGQVSYEWKNMVFAVSAQNLANRQYYVPYPYLDGRVAPAQGRSVFASIRTRF